MEKKLRIPYNHITTLKKRKTALVIDNAIYVTTSRITYQVLHSALLDWS
jgi:hypothetical protein